MTKKDADFIIKLIIQPDKNRRNHRENVQESNVLHGHSRGVSGLENNVQTMLCGGKEGSQLGEARFRHELKYNITTQQAACLLARMRCVLKPDPHAGAAGAYNIRSLYFDDYDDTCMEQNMAGTDPRQKYRIRIYNRSADRIRLELKRKVRSKTQKLSCPLTQAQCRQLMQGRPLTGEQLREAPELLVRFCMEMRTRLLRPKVIVEYDRVPYICPLGNVRITLDCNISSSTAVDRFLERTIPLRPIMAAGSQLLEVKFDDFLPDVIYHGLQLKNLRQTSFSKYYLCRIYQFNKEVSKL